MQTLQVSTNRQIVIPYEVVKQLNYQADDILEVVIKDNVLALKPTKSTEKPKSRFEEIMKYAGIGEVLKDKNNPDATVQEIREDRDSWQF